MHFEVYISGHFLFIRSGKEDDDKKYKDIRLVHLIFFLGSVYVLFLVFKNSTFYWAMVYDTYTRFSVYSSSSDEESVTRRYVLLTSSFQRFAIYIIYHNHVSSVVHTLPPFALEISLFNLLRTYVQFLVSKTTTNERRDQLVMRNRTKRYTQTSVYIYLYG